MEPLNAYNKPLRYFDEENNLYTHEMFLELDDSGESWRQFTLQTWDVTYQGREYRSLHKLYVDSNDPSEYTFANTYFYNFAHWELVKSHPAIRPHYDVMRKELEAKLSTKAIQAMIAQVMSGTATQATLKFLANKEYIDAPTSRPASTSNARGRPSKLASVSSLTPSNSDDDHQSDLERMQS